MSKQSVYTPEIVEQIVEDYKKAKDDESRAAVVEEWSETLGVSPASVRAKLVQLKVYVAKQRTTKTGAPVETKGKMVEDIARLMGVSAEVVESLEKATKPVLRMLREKLAGGEQKRA